MSENKLVYRKMSPEELVLPSQNNDFKALEELIRKIQADVFATLSYMVKNNDNISDLTQEILLKVAKNIQKLKNPKCLKGWLNQIITNTYYDYIRKNKKIPETISIDYTCEPLNFSLKVEIPDKKTKPIEKCITSECEKMIKSAIHQLPERFRIAIILREFQGLSYDEIAKLTNSSLGTVKSRISRARIKLQETLKNYI
jgi:RNA polymerase sigma-70 factor (ECF subfamily)